VGIRSADPVLPYLIASGRLGVMTKTDAKWLERIRHWKESGRTAEEFAVGQPFKASTL
jgi:hypothetical protein